MKKRYLILALILLLVFNMDVLQAQKPSKNIRVPKIEVVGKDGEKFSLKVSEVKVDVKVVGSIAVTTIDIIFKNDLGRILEGELNFPLAEGQTVSRFAMDLNGKLREGVVVEKAKGRVAFEEVVRKRIDPALLEQTVGNNFKARIYPIPAKGTKRIVMAYEEELPNSEDGLTYRLPLNYPDKLEKFSLNAVVYERNSAPDARNNDLPGVDFKKDGSGFATSVRMKNYIAKNQFEFMLPSDNKSSVMIEERDGKSYFLLNLSPVAELLEKELPKKICLFYDISNSSANRDFEMEADFIRQYFAKLGNFELELIPFSNQILSTEKFNIRGGIAEELINKLRSFRSDGGTQLGAIDFYRYDCDEFLLFSDGISNFGAKEIILGRKPVVTVNSNQSAEHSYL
ncbi:MAG: VIT domain-containing protein [Candidatus Kapabacteria bacterium]|jgi:hypothetical protein|nr:VIT domain-containing protein [Candidatus Kapabacteria bacterium]